MNRPDRHPGPIQPTNDMSPIKRPSATDAPITTVEGWRLEQFEAMGCAPELAATLAVIKHLDLRGFQALIRKGCAPQTAARILLPEDYTA